MYHYVRDLEHSRFPGINGLSIERFRRQLDYIQTHFVPITVDRLLQAARSVDNELPSNSILLTFDDGYSDHFTNVFPLLDAEGIQGCFFPPAKAVLENRVLDVNKIHFVLSAVPDAGRLLDQVFGSLSEFESQYTFKTREAYFQSFVGDHRYDTREVIFLKRLLQRELPEPVRAEIVRRLFAEYVTSDEASFSRELYMSVEQMASMRTRGMHIGSHGYSHAWLDRLSPDDQAVEIDRSIEFLRLLGVPATDWTMCYPYGGYNDSLLQLLRTRNCQLGFGVESRTADLAEDERLALPRIDTNDLPN